MAVSTIKAEFKCEIEKVWELVTSLDNYSWRSDIDKIIVTVPEKEFEEHTKDGYVTKFKITAFDEYKNYEFDMENGNMQGHWTGKFSYNDGVTFIEFTEDVTAKNLIIKLKSYDEFISNWITSTHTYKKRAAFTLIASSVVHNKTITNDTLDDYLRIVQEYSDSEHEHVRKAISWALREIGKKDFTYNEKAILLAHELKESGNKNKMWIAKDALKELETLVKVEGRGRLISSNSKMGRE